MSGRHRYRMFAGSFMIYKLKVNGYESKKLLYRKPDFNRAEQHPGGQKAIPD